MNIFGMNHKLQTVAGTPSFYSLVSDSYLNHYHIITHPATCLLMASPEQIGFSCYQAMKAPTTAALRKLMSADSERLHRVDILTILRGGLNYPIEECCHECGIKVPNINFLSCERVITDGMIMGLDIKYEKIHTEPHCTLMIGDIIASGDTFRLCLDYVIKQFRTNGHDIRKIVFFTIGGTKAITMLEDFTTRLRQVWPTFEGFECVFYEGVFSVYEDKGVTGVNIPNIDFGWTNGTIAPEFRHYIFNYTHAPALLEKCIIYDGGARRYELDVHREEVTGYWKDLLKVSADMNMEEFLAEKIGHGHVTYEEWIALNNYEPTLDLKDLYDEEQAYMNQLRRRSLTNICKTRLAQLEEFFSNLSIEKAF